jgi:hypothetical protein
VGGDTKVRGQLPSAICHSREPALRRISLGEMRTGRMTRQIKDMKQKLRTGGRDAPRSRKLMGRTQMRNLGEKNQHPTQAGGRLTCDSGRRWVNRAENRSS